MGLFGKMLKRSNDATPVNAVAKKKPVSWRIEVERPDEWLCGAGSFAIHTKYWYGDVRIAGVEFRDFDYSKLKNDSLKLVKEPENNVDPLAIRVEQEGQHIGYVPANRLQKMIHEWNGSEDYPQGLPATSMAKLVAVDEESKLLEMELSFIEFVDADKAEALDDGYDYLD